MELVIIKEVRLLHGNECRIYGGSYIVYGIVDFSSVFDIVNMICWQVTVDMRMQLYHSQTSQLPSQVTRIPMGLIQSVKKRYLRLRPSQSQKLSCCLPHSLDIHGRDTMMLVSDYLATFTVTLSTRVLTDFHRRHWGWCHPVFILTNLTTLFSHRPLESDDLFF